MKKLVSDLNMKKLVSIAAVMSMFGSIAFAGQITGTVVGMEESYKNVVKSVPVQNCQVVDVPIYKEVATGGGASTGDVLAGAIIGGVIGNQFGNGKGKDAMTVLGAIVGADSVNKKGQRETVIVGYRQQQQCSTSYSNQEVRVRGNNIVTVETDDGNEYKFETTGWYKMGTVVFLNVTLSQ